MEESPHHAQGPSHPVLPLPPGIRPGRCGHPGPVQLPRTIDAGGKGKENWGRRLIDRPPGDFPRSDPEPPPVTRHLLMIPAMTLALALIQGRPGLADDTV